jgi:hypothetical protein
MQRFIFSILVMMSFVGMPAPVRGQVGERRPRVSSVLTHGDTLMWIRPQAQSADSVARLDTVFFLRRGAATYMRSAGTWVLVPLELARHVWRLDTLARDRERLRAKLSLSGVRVPP